MHLRALYVVLYSSHDYWIILCIAHWNCILVSVHVIFYFEVLLAVMIIFETENRFKLYSHNTGQINHQSASWLKNQSLAGFLMLHEKKRLKFSLLHYLSWWPLLTLGSTSRGGRWGENATPRVFLTFFQEDNTSATDVFSSCSLIPSADFETSLAMVSCYGYETWCHK